MIEAKLRKAICLDNQISTIQAEIRDLKAAEKLCRGNTLDMQGKAFKVVIAERGSTRDAVAIVSDDSARKALYSEIEAKEEKLAVLLDEFSKL